MLGDAGVGMGEAGEGGSGAVVGGVRGRVREGKRCHTRTRQGWCIGPERRVSGGELPHTLFSTLQF